MHRVREEAWWRNGVIYQIYPRSFVDSDGDGIGDLPGIVSKLDYLNDGTADSLGVSAIWISPFFPSPAADFGYDISDFCDVDPVFGHLGDFDALIREARSRGIKILIDLVLNHTSTEHPWFGESRSSRDNPKRDWYVWASPRDDGSPPNNWLSAFPRVGRAWTRDDATGDFYLHTFTAQQADLNWRNPDVREAMWEVVRFWLDRGVDGFRVDVAHRLMKDPLLRDNPLVLAHEPRHVSHPVERQMNVDHPDVHEVLRELREVTDRYPDRTTLGEVPIHDPSRLVRYYGEDDELHMVFHFALWDLPWDASAFRGRVDSLEAALPEWAWPCNALSNHDIPRIATRYDEDGRGRARARVAAMLLLTLRGTPCLYYGEELGMQSAPIWPPVREMDVDGRDPSRTPMQWDQSGGGFSSGVPWLPGGAEAETTVAGQLHDPGSMLSLYRRLIRLRDGSKALRCGQYEPIDVSENVFAYRRWDGHETFVILLNFASSRVEVLNLPSHSESVVEVSTDPSRAVTCAAPDPLTLAPEEGIVLRSLPHEAGP